MKRKFKQLKYEERVQIESLKKEGFSLRYIALVLKRSPNTIAREWKERRVKGAYVPKKAQHKAYWRRYMSKRDCMKVALDSFLSKLVEEKLKCGWSPERIAGYATLHGNKVSTKAVYKFVYSRALDHQLFWRKHKKKSGRKRYSNTLQITRNFIDLRPTLNGLGHLEADFIVSSLSSWCLLVVVDRYARYVWIEKIPNRKHAVVMRVFQRILGEMNVKSITTDNDIAFLGWKQLEKVLHTRIYFTHPYHS